MSSLAPSIFLLLQAAADSVGTRIVVEHSWLDTAANVGQSLVSFLVLVMLVMGVLLLYALKKTIDELTKLIRSAYEPLRTAIAEAREVTGEVRAMAKGLKAPVERASETIDEASDRFRAVMDVTEGRLARLDELVNIVQEEAEGAVLGAASLMRGVRAGGQAVRRSLGLARRDEASRRRGRGTGDEEDEADEGDELDDATDELESGTEVEAEGADEEGAEDDAPATREHEEEADEEPTEAPRIRARSDARTGTRR
jgi:F0F1-type ATP synthase membrane subunit b/b'